MSDETLNLLRRAMIDMALERGDEAAFRNLTGPNWKSFVVDTRGSQGRAQNATQPTEGADPADRTDRPAPSEQADPVDPVDRFAFLTEDPHFWDLRVLEKTLVRVYLNYRFRDAIGGVLYVGEIRVPIGWPGQVEVKFHPRPSSGPWVQLPDWFQTLLAETVAVLHKDAAD